MTPEQLKAKFPHASQAFIDANSSGPSAADTQQPEKRSLVDLSPGDETRRDSTSCRATVSVTVFAVRPADSDGWHLKEIVDCLVHAGILDGDAWNQLEIAVRSEKVHEKEAERTQIQIVWPDHNV